jgi:hypothetical protein
MVYGEGGMVMMGDEGSYQASYDGYSDDSESDDEDSVTRVRGQLVPIPSVEGIIDSHGTQRSTCGSASHVRGEKGWRKG